MGRVDTPQFANPFTPQVDQPYLTLGEFTEHVLAVTNLSLRDIKADGIRLTGKPGVADGPVWLEITTYCRDEKGQVYFDDSREVATEIRRFPIAALTLNRGL